MDSPRDTSVTLEDTLWEEVYTSNCLEIHLDKGLTGDHNQTGSPGMARLRLKRSYGKISVHELSAWTSLKFKARKCASLPLMHTQMNENVGAPTVCLRKAMEQCHCGLPTRFQINEAREQDITQLASD
ncbi:hypothetical protein J6590_099139 [Homalodisca vitripennis]|nr:hypothetical protein J6590_099139 [Homalodisca vitripennis]